MYSSDSATEFPRPQQMTPNSSAEGSIESTPTATTAGCNYDDPEKMTAHQLSRVSEEHPLSRKVTSAGTVGTNIPDFEVDWDGEDDQMNPRNWPLWYKGMTIGFMSWGTWTVVLYSTSYTTGLPQMMRDFHVSSEPLVTLGVTTYLVGLATGSVIVAPLSEMYGRKPVYIIAMFIFVILIIPCGLATSLAEVLVVRFFGAIAGSVMISNAPGTVSDIVTDEYRALAFSIWSIGPLNGPTFGPIIGGFSTEYGSSGFVLPRDADCKFRYLGWKWTNWIVMIVAGVAWVFVWLLKETYTPVLLKRKAKRRREETGDDRFWSHYDDQKTSLPSLLRTNLSRPFIMIFTEPIWYACFYTS